MNLALHIIGWWFLISLTLGPVLAWSFFWAAKVGDAPTEERKPFGMGEQTARNMMKFGTAAIGKRPTAE
jgi:hypothetical protein